MGWKDALGSIFGGASNAASPALGQIMGGQPIEQRSQSTATTTHQAPEAAIPEQMALLRQLIGAQSAGSGEAGFGPAARQGNATLMQALASRGIDPRSPVAGGALAQYLAQAAVGDSANRRQFGLGLINSNPRMFSRGSTVEQSGYGTTHDPNSGIWADARDMLMFNQFSGD